MIERIYAVWVYVKDLEKSRRFYEDILGMKFRLREKEWIEFDLGETSFAILQRPAEKGPLKPKKTRIMLQVGDINKMKERLLSNGVKVIGIRDEPYGKLLTFEDPNGHWLELFEPKAIA